MDARGKAMVTWGAIVADLSPEECEVIRAEWAAKLDAAFPKAQPADLTAACN